MSHHVWDERHVEIQDRQNEHAAVRQARERTVELLTDADVVLDLGCGTGTGAAELPGLAVGIDSSSVMVATAAAHGVPACQALVDAVPIRSNSVGGVRLDRILYHLAEPVNALREAVRVTRVGGRIVCTHPDHESMVIAVPGAPDHLIALTKWTRVELNYVNGKVPHHIPQMLADLGCRDVHTEAFTLVVEDPDDPSFAIPHWLRSWRDRGAIDVSDADLDTWDDAIDTCRSGSGFFFTITYLLTHALVG